MPWTGAFALLVGVCLCPFFHLPASMAAEPKKGLSAEQLLDLHEVREVALSPDGKTVAYTVRGHRARGARPGERYSPLFVLRIGQKQTPRPYTRRHGSVRGISFTPDSRRVTYLENTGDGAAQVWAVPLEGGAAEALTDAPEGVMGYAFSPDGSRVAYTTPAPEAPGPKKARRRGYDGNVAGSAPRHHLLLVATLGTAGEPARVSPEDRSVFDFAWSPAGQDLAVMLAASPRADDGYMYRSLWRFSAAGGPGKVLAEGMGKMVTPRWSPDGKLVGWLGAARPTDGTHGTLWVVRADGGDPVATNAGAEETVYDFHWVAPGRVLVAAVTGTRSIVTERPVDGKGKHRVVLRDGPSLIGLAVDRAGSQFAFSGSTALHPPEVFLGEVSGSGAKRLTWSNAWLEDLVLARQEPIEWKGQDGLAIDGVLLYPVEYREGQRYPLVVMVHGGPEWQALNGWVGSYMSPGQVMAAQGYAVLDANYRGSAGRGVDFATADHRDLGGKELDDIISGVRHLVEKGLVDELRVGMMGGSYGGYMSMMAATKASKHFAAAVAFAGIANWMSYLGTTDIPHEMSLVHWDIYCWDEPDRCWRSSPLSFLSGASTPLLLVHGEEDVRVPVGQSREIHAAFEHKKIPTGLVTYPREGHGLSERAHQEDFLRRTLEWFGKYLRGST